MVRLDSFKYLAGKRDVIFNLRFAILNYTHTLQILLYHVRYSYNFSTPLSFAIPKVPE